MFVQTSRYSLNGAASEAAAHQIYEKAMPLWAAAGAHSMNRYRIAEGDKAGQMMVVVRFTTRDQWSSGRDAIAGQRETLAQELEAAGIKNEETMLLDEVASA